MNIDTIITLPDLGSFVKTNTPDSKLSDLILLHLLSIGLRLKAHFVRDCDKLFWQDSGTDVYIDDDVKEDRAGFFFVYRFPKDEIIGIFLVTKDETIVDFYPLTEWPQQQMPIVIKENHEHPQN